MGWIGSPEEQRKFDIEVDRKWREEDLKKKFGKFFLCKQCKKECWKVWDDDELKDIETRPGCYDYKNIDDLEDEQDGLINGKAW